MAKATATKTAPAKAPATQSKAVAKVEAKSTALAPIDDEMLSDLLQDAGAGLESATAADYALPFIYLLQKMSPQVDKDDAKYVEGAEPGKFINTVTQELYDELRVIPVHFEKVYIEWIPRDLGGGFVASYKTRQDADKNCEEGHQIVDTANHYVLVQGKDGEWTPAILSLTSTKLKASRNWVSKMGMVTIMGPNQKKVVAPTYSRFYDVLPDGPMKNDKGTYYVIKVDSVEGEDGWVKDPELRDQAKNFRASLQAGLKGADYNRSAEVVDAEIEDAAGEPTY